MEIGKFLYHKSNPIFRDKIAVEGLIVKGISETWLSDTPINGKVIFATNSEDRSKWFDDDYDDDIYRIDTSELSNKWDKDPNFDGVGIHYDSHVITFENIPLSAIELIYKGTGKSKI